jgi:hypothetical protein
MAKNDVIIIDGILDDRVAECLPSNKRDEAFEYFSIEQILKDHNLNKDDILSGIIDGKDDGGIDGIYILINGHLLVDPDNFFWPKTNAELEIHIINCKHHDTFKQAPLDNVTATTSEIFDFSIDKKDLKGSYNKALLSKRDLLKIAYRKVASRLTAFKIHITYASRGDADDVGDSILSRGNQIKNIIEQSFTDSKVKINFIGSTQLVELSRKLPNFSLDLSFIEVLGKGERYVILTKITEYKNFVTDGDGKLRRYLFDSNVRDFMGLNRVNEEIKNTLEHDVSTDFWWLNNGVTILATSAKVIGKTMHIEDIQIVNGLQTTESIYKYFEAGGLDINERSVLIKVIVSTEEEVRDSIIRATNNQTNVELTALHATDKIQRDIEDILLRAGLHYERRTKFYQNQGIPQSQIITPLYIASGYFNLVLKDPYNAAMLKSKFMRNESSYEEIFSHKTSMEVWPQIAKILKTTDEFLEDVRPLGHSSNDRFLKRYRYILSLMGVGVLAKNINFTTTDLISIDTDEYNSKLLKELWEGIILNQGELTNSRVLPFDTTLSFLDSLASNRGLVGLDEFIGRNKARLRKVVQIDRLTVEKIFEALPLIPYDASHYKSLISELGISRAEVFKSIKILRREGRIKTVDKNVHQINN